MSNSQEAPSPARSILGRIGPLIGGALCAAAALAASAVATGHPWQVWVPLAFSAVPLVIAWFFGLRAGILGTLLAAVVFAFFLFSPVRSVHVADGAARANLGWMLLIGITFSLLFAPSASSLRRRESRSQTTEPDSPAS